MRPAGIVMAMTAGALLVTAAPAQAVDDTPGCVTRHEFKVVKLEQTRKHVHHAWGTAGRLIENTGAVQRRKYKICHVAGYQVRATFVYYDDAWRLSHKHANAQ